MIRLLLFSLALSVMFAAPAQAQQCGDPPTSGLVGHWTLDESGAPYADSSSLNNDATVGGGAPTSVSGIINGGVDFSDAEESRLEAPATQTYKDLRPITVSAWINPSEFSGHMGIIEIGELFQFFVPFNKSEIRFEADAWDTQTGQWKSSPDVLSTNQWFHVAATYNYNDPVGTMPVFYINGAEVTASKTGEPDGSVTPPADGSVMIGNVDITGITRNFHGAIDDVRIYDRVLSAEEIAELHAYGHGEEAVMLYDQRHARLMYCNGTDWVHAGTGSYNPNAVVFDGTSDYLEESNPMTGVTDGKKGALSMWFKLNDVSEDKYFLRNAAARILVQFEFGDGGQMRIWGENSSNVGILDMGSANFNGDTTGWHHLLASWDLSDPAKRHVYIDGAADLDTVNYTTHTNDSIQYSNGWWRVGGDAGTRMVDGQIADFWFDANTYIDLSVEDNRRAFRSPAGLPKYLGKDGSIPLGKKPDIFLTGDTANWHVNKGAGGGFTENGEITYSSSRPGDSLITGSCASPTAPAGEIIYNNDYGVMQYCNGVDWVAMGPLSFLGPGLPDDASLIAHWKFDEVNDYPVPWRPTGGQVNGAIELDGGADHINLNNPASVPTSGPVTVSAWINNTGVSDDGDSPWFKKGEANGYGLYVRSNNIHVITFNVSNWNTGYTITQGQWYHVVFTYDGTDKKVYVNGNLEAIKSGEGYNTANATAYIGRNTVGNEAGYFKGFIDDVRVYDRALSATEVSDLYGGGPEPANLVAHWKLDESSGMVAADSAGTADGFFAVTFSTPETVSGQETPSMGSVQFLPTGGVLNGAMKFDGADDFFVAPFFDETLLPTTMTAWVKLDAAHGCGGLIYSLTGTNSGIYVGGCPDGSKVSYQWNTTQWGWDNGSVYPLNEWFHVALVVEADKATTYVHAQDGSEVATNAASHSSATFKNINIGSESGRARFFKGIADDVRIYNRALTASEIADCCVPPPPRNCADPAMPEGAMVYNKDHNVMQYCNGENWIGIGWTPP